jgi:phage tail tape-measure protein
MFTQLARPTAGARRRAHAEGGARRLAAARPAAAAPCTRARAHHLRHLRPQRRQLLLQARHIGGVVRHGGRAVLAVVLVYFLFLSLSLSRSLARARDAGARAGWMGLAAALGTERWAPAPRRSLAGGEQGREPEGALRVQPAPPPRWCTGGCSGGGGAQRLQSIC